MAEPFVGEIRMFGGDFAPRGWEFCDGQLLAIVGNEALFSLLGTTYGGNGTTTFGLPDLRGRIPIHQGRGSSGTNYRMGEAAGAESVTLTVAQMPAHTHGMQGSTAAADSPSPEGRVPAAQAKLYQSSAPDASMAAQSVTMAGGSQSHDNMMPYQCVSFIIALEGIYPQRS